ncbi:tyrosine-protein phosphatase non-receptor type 11-like isoform X2 [Dysidea avara]|uniref:tyrosine-protein phosphatase non-receptor type 11-like isoform X2 n=1 Tax=Dysidea avara TaxID=196820 RepID=UPI003320183B
MQSAVDHRCFHPHITGEEAEQLLLASGNHGSFLCRRSREDPNTYTLSVLNFGDVVHLRMKYTAPYFSLHDEEQFESPFDIIQHYLDGHDVLRRYRGGAIHLINPLNNENTIKARWYHGDIHPEVVKALLNDKGQDGSFLVRTSYKSPGDYSLCVRVKDEIVDVKVFGKGKKFDLGLGKQFDSVEDLIEYYRKSPFSVSGGAQVKLQKEIETDISAGLSHNTIFHRCLTPSLPQASCDDCSQPVSDVNWEYRGTYTLTAYGDEIGNSGLLQVCVKDGQYSLNLHGNHYDESSYFRLYHTSFLEPQCNTICLESARHPGCFIKWNSASQSIEFLKGTPKNPPKNIRCIGWNTMIPPNKGDPPSTQSLRAWRKQPEDRQHPLRYLFNFGLPDNASTDSKDCVPGLKNRF